MWIDTKSGRNFTWYNVMFLFEFAPHRAERESCSSKAEYGREMTSLDPLSLTSKHGIKYSVCGWLFERWWCVEGHATSAVLAFNNYISPNIGVSNKGGSVQ